MFKRVVIGGGVACLLALLMVFGVLAGRRNRRPASPPTEAQEKLGEATQPGPPRSAPPAVPPQAAPAPAPSIAASPKAEPPPLRKRDESPAPLDEPALMAKLRGLEGTDPPLTLKLAREGNARLPDSPDAPERAWMIVKSLANMEKFHEARDEAQVMVNRYPNTSWSLDVQRHLLSNPLD